MVCLGVFVLWFSLPVMAGTLTLASGSKFTMYTGPYGVWVSTTGVGNLNPSTVTWSATGAIAPVGAEYLGQTAPPPDFTSFFHWFNFFGFWSFTYTGGTSYISLDNTGRVNLDLSTLYWHWPSNGPIPIPLSGVCT